MGGFAMRAAGAESGYAIRADTGAPDEARENSEDSFVGPLISCPRLPLSLLNTQSLR